MVELELEVYLLTNTRRYVNFHYMPFKPFLRTDAFSRDSSPKISIRKEQIGFNAAFVKIANLQNFSKVKIEVDEEEFKIGFRFDNEGGSNALALFSDNPSHSTKATGAMNLFKRYLFIKKISELQNPLERQFEVKEDIQDKRFWVAQLCPAFEGTASSQSDLKNLKGIYCYKRSDGMVVYIGKGDIHSRLNSPVRQDWDFDVIEYSIIEDPNEQSRWENYWLDKYVEKEGRLPFYNKIKGKGSKNE